MSSPSNLRIFHDDYSRYVSRRQEMFGQEVANATRAIETRGARTTTVHNLAELRQNVYFHDNYYHNVLSDENQLAISSIADKNEFNLISHQALAFMENISGPVKMAGTIRADARGVYVITNQSGHYLPLPPSLKHMEALLASWGAIAELVEMPLVARGVT